MATSPTAHPAGDAPNSPHLPRASGKFVSHVLTLITGNGVAQVINVVGTLLLAHLFRAGRVWIVRIVRHGRVVPLRAGRGALRTGHHAAGTRTRKQRTFCCWQCSRFCGICGVSVLPGGLVQFRNGAIIGRSAAGTLAVVRSARHFRKQPVFHFGSVVWPDEAVSENCDGARLAVAGNHPRAAGPALYASRRLRAGRRLGNRTIARHAAFYWCSFFILTVNSCRCLPVGGGSRRSKKISQFPDLQSAVQFRGQRFLADCLP